MAFSFTGNLIVDVSACAEDLELSQNRQERSRAHFAYCQGFWASDASVYSTSFSLRFLPP